MEELNSAWVRMTKLLHALEAQANEMDQKMADVRALAISPQPTPPTVPELLKKSGQSMPPTTLTVTEANAQQERERPRSLSANLAGYSSLSGGKGRDDDIHITAAVSIAHKDGLSYDEHELVVPFNSTIDRVKRLIFQVVPQLHENRLDEFELSIDGEELMVEFNRFSELPAVRMAIASREPVMVEVQAKESKKKRNSKKKEKKAKGSKLHLSGGSKVVAKTLTPTLERRGAGTSTDAPGRSVLGLRPTAPSPDILGDRPGTPTRERRRDSDPRSFAASSRDLQRIATVTDDKTARGLSPTTLSPSGRGGRGSFGSSTELPTGRERSGSAIVVRDREKRTASDASSEGDSVSLVSTVVTAQAAPDGRASTSTSAAKQLRQSKSPRADSSEQEGSGSGASTLSVHSGRRSRKEGHKRSHSSDSRETDAIVDLELDALKDLVVGDLSLDLDLKLGIIKTGPNEGATTHKRSSKHASRGDEASDHSASPASGTRSQTTKHDKKKLRSVSQSSRNNVRDMNARPSADKGKKAPHDADDDERQSLKLLLASLDPGALIIPAAEPSSPSSSSSASSALPLPAAKAKSKSRSGDTGHVRKQQTRERAASAKTTVAAPANNNNNKNNGGNSVEMSDRVKELEEREKKLLEWEEQLFKEEMERDEKREAEVASRAKAADELEREVRRREAAVADRERAVDDVLRQREQEIEQRLSEKVAEEVRKTFEARMLILVDWEERLRKQESDFREREVSRLGLKSVARYDELLQVGKERVVRMQCYVRRALARLRVQRALGDGPGRDVVMKQLKSRAGTLNEIIKSEAAYVQYLTVLMEAFAVPIRQKEVLRLDDQLCLFANIGSVLSLHRRFLGDLKDRYAKWPSQPMLGDLFCNYIKLFHEEYAVYVLSYHASIELLHRLKASPTKTAFLSFVEKTQSERSKQLRGLDLSSFLIMPVQRIPRYQILLAEVLANTPPGHADLPSLRTSLEKIKGLNESLNDKQKEADLLRRVQDLERKKSESQTPLRRSKSMRALLFLSKRRGSLTSIDGDSQYGKHLAVNAIHRQPAKVRAEPGSLLKVFVHQGKNLLPIGDDARTVPDPYCVIMLSGQMLRTSIIEGTSDPQWNQDFTYNVTSVSDSLCVTCYDWNQSARTRPLGFIELPFSVIAEIAQGTAQWFRLLPVFKQGHGSFQATSSSPSLASSTLASRMSTSSASLRLPHQDSLLPALRHGRASMPPTLQLSSLPAAGEGGESSPDGGVRVSPRPRRLTPYSVVPSTEMGASADAVEWLAEMEVQLSFSLHQIDTAHTDATLALG